MLPVILTACSNEEAASEAFAALEEEYSAGREAISEEMDSLPDLSEDPDSAELAAYRALVDGRSAKFEEYTESFLPRFEALAEEYWGTEAGLEAKIWAMSRAPQPDPAEDGEDDEVDPEEAMEAAREARAAIIGEHIDAIFEEYAESPHIEKLAENSYLLTEEQSEKYLGELRENSPHANVRAAAIYYPASRKLSDLQFEAFMAERRVEIKVDPPEELDLRDDGGSAEDEGPAEEVDPREEINKDLQLLIDEYGDIPMGGSTYRAVAYAHLTAHSEEELAIGRPAPEIIGTDVDGNEMRLSQFLGKVVVLDFWGDW
jgi:hypothetical protein